VVLGIDLGKNSCSLAGLDCVRPGYFETCECGGVRWRASSGARACIVAMEACCGAHHLGRVSLPRARNTSDVAGICRPYVKAQKNDELDAEAIAEAATRPTMPVRCGEEPVSIDVQALHRAREAWCRSGQR